MPDYGPLLNVMKQAGVNANEANNPVKVCFGEVMSKSPIKIMVDQKIPLGKAQLTFTETVKSLSKGDCVLLIRMQGGQKYVVIDKVVTDA